ncbi:MAG: YARHG domain-containing protein [Ruminococcaceae bacterium]|nr:YARHG domain-containing protein [Oscillospiraceae bacterium]
MFCAKCGNPNADDSRFCGVCGAPLTKPTQPTVTPQTAPCPQVPVQPPMQQQVPVQPPVQPIAPVPPTPYKPYQASPPKNPENEPKKRGSGALVVTVIVLLILIVALVAALIYMLLSPKDEKKVSAQQTQLTIVGTTASSTVKTTGHTFESTYVVQTQEPETVSTEPTTEETTEKPSETQAEIFTGPLDADGYLLAESNIRYLNESDIAGLSESALQYAINEIYARHGYIFNSPRIKAHFESLWWYYGTTPSTEFSFDVLNIYEQANLVFLEKAKQELEA